MNKVEAINLVSELNMQVTELKIDSNKVYTDVSKRVLAKAIKDREESVEYITKKYIKPVGRV